jgi:hypothetical protein
MLGMDISFSFHGWNHHPSLSIPEDELKKWDCLFFQKRTWRFKQASRLSMHVHRTFILKRHTALIPFATAC